MLAISGLALTALGTILAIVHPSIGAKWASKRTQEQERRLRLRYYSGISLIIIGTIMQIVAAYLAK